MISRITVTARNYRISLFLTSEKFIIAKFSEAMINRLTGFTRQVGLMRRGWKLSNYLKCSIFLIFVSQISAENRRDPEPGVSGSPERRRRIIAGSSEIRSDYCHLWIIAFQFINMIDFCRK
ncbi:hypothetical protein A3465_03715 [Enterobacter roggenkampii]|nr:hypothetical protein CES92_24070 [Enterobacter roggenkampii]KZQ77872.1 hypothetical protein A3465_03715 [Enterobacter roggenkampii]HAS1418236.1 hypothetical protein [Enterobacter asburiae]HAS1562563.1 hypothetical protein [Enterobacter asburiae]